MAPSLNELSDRSFLEAILDPKFDSNLFGATNDLSKEEDFINVIAQKNARGQKYVPQIKKDIKRQEKYLRAIGETPPEPPGENMLYQALDFLDTGGQFVRGAGAKALGHPEFKDLNYLDAAAKANDLDVSTGALLRENSFFKDHPFLRGAAGFVGDVLTDPLNWLSFGKGSAKQLGGLAVDDALPIAKVGNESLTASQVHSKLTQQYQKKNLIDLSKKFGKTLDPSMSLDDLIASSGKDLTDLGLVGEALTKGEKQASQPFKELGDVFLQDKKLDPLKSLNLSPEVRSALDGVLGVRGEKLSRITGNLAETLGPGAEILPEIEQIAKRPAIRFSSPLAGIPTFERMPLLGARELDIPAVTELSEGFYKGLNDIYYGAPVKLKSFLADKATTNPDSHFWKAADWFGGLMSDANKLGKDTASLISRRIRANGEWFGSSRTREVIQEHERARGALAESVFRSSAVRFGDIITQPDSDKVLSEVGEVLFKANRAKDEISGQTILQEFYDARNAKNPGEGDKLQGVIEWVTREFDELAEKDKQAGFIGNVLENYLPQLYKLPAGIDPKNSDEYRQLVRQFTGANKGSGMQKAGLKQVIKELDAAKVKGLTPNTNLFEMYFQRKFWSETLHAEKDFAERLALQYALPKDVYDKLDMLANAESDVLARQAQGVLNTLDLPAQGGLAPVKMLPGGRPLLNDTYNTIRQYFSRDELGKLVSNQKLAEANPQAAKAALEAIEKLGLRLDDVELQEIGQQSDTYLKSIMNRLGRRGEGALARAGATTLPEKVLSRISPHVSETDKKFWTGLLPRSLSNALEESYNMSDVLKAHAKRLPDPEDKQILGKLIRGWQKYIHIPHKAAATVFYPAFHIRNVMGMPFQMLEHASVLGEALNPMLVLQNKKLLAGGLDGIVDVAGKKITRQQLLAEMAQYGVQSKNANDLKLLDDMGDMLLALGGDKEFSAKYPLLNKYAPKPKNMLQKIVDPFTSFGNTLETAGRRHLYLGLRRQGYDASSAANLTNRLLIDYSSGKTRAEKNYLNNIFFFYAFSRGNATNQFLNLIRKPGALTTSLAAQKGVAEMFTDPELQIDSPDMEEELKSIRQRETLSFYLGKNKKTGAARVMTSLGLPMEDVGKYLALYQPKGEKWADILQAAGDSGGRTAKLFVSQLNPALRGVLEGMVFKKNLFFDRPITDETLRKIPKWERDMGTILHYPSYAVPKQLWEAMDDATKAITGGRDNGDGTMTISPTAAVVLSYFVPGASRALSTREALSKPGTSAQEKYSRLFTGIKINEPNLEQSSLFDRKRQLQEYAIDRGYPTSKAKLQAYKRFNEDAPEDDE